MLGLLIRNNMFFLSALFVFSLVLRVVVFSTYLGNDENYWQIDSVSYHDVALAIAAGKGITRADGSPNFYRLPLYPLFLSLYYRVVGVSKRNVLWIQIILAALLPLLIFMLSMVLFPRQVVLARLAAFLASIHLGFVLYSGFFMSESLFLVFFLLFALFFFGAVHLFFCRRGAKAQADVEQSFIRSAVYGFCPEPACEGLVFANYLESEPRYYLSALFFAGIFLGLASLTRAVGHYCLVLSCLIILFSSNEVRYKIKKIAVFIFGWFIVVAPWLIRNYVLAGHLFFHTLSGGHFLSLSAARIVAHTRSISYQQALDIVGREWDNVIAQREQKTGRKLSEIERCNVGERLAARYCMAHPTLAVKNWLFDMFRTLFSLYSGELLFLDTGRKPIDYFSRKRTFSSMLQRFLMPQVSTPFLQFVIWGEILFFFIMLLGLMGGLVTMLVTIVWYWRSERAYIRGCIWLRLLPFMGLFIVLSLAGGYARMRLPIEPFIIILSLNFWRFVYVWIKSRMGLA